MMFAPQQQSFDQSAMQPNEQWSVCPLSVRLEPSTRLAVAAYFLAHPSRSLTLLPLSFRVQSHSSWPIGRWLHRCAGAARSSPSASTARRRARRSRASSTRRERRPRCDAASSTSSASGSSSRRIGARPIIIYGRGIAARRHRHRAAGPAGRAARWAGRAAAWRWVDGATRSLENGALMTAAAGLFTTIRICPTRPERPVIGSVTSAATSTSRIGYDVIDAMLSRRRRLGKGGGRRRIDARIQLCSARPIAQRGEQESEGAHAPRTFSLCSPSFVCVCAAASSPPTWPSSTPYASLARSPASPPSLHNAARAHQRRLRTLPNRPPATTSFADLESPRPSSPHYHAARLRWRVRRRSSGRHIREARAVRAAVWRYGYWKGIGETCDGTQG